MSRPTILVVDDERGIRELIVAVLEDEGYQAIAASSGAHALATMARVRPDLVLLDVMMPDLDGRETLRRMRHEPRLASIPVIMMSAAFSADRIGQPVAAFIPKPFDLDHLIETVATILTLSR